MANVEVKKIVENIRLKLLDLTKRNRLLNYRPTAKSIQIIDELPDQIYQLILDGKNLELLPFPEPEEESAENQDNLPLVPQDNVEPRQKDKSLLPDIDLGPELPIPSTSIANKHLDTRLQTPLTSKYLERRCRKLTSESRLAIEETGSNLLYLALGFLEWYEDDNSAEPYKAPLILIPISIERTRLDRETNCYKYVIAYTNEDIGRNLSLALKLDHDFNLILPWFEEEDSPEQYFEKVRDTISGKRRWRMAREAVIGLFSFSKIAMYKDLDFSRWPDKWKLDRNDNILRLLIGGASESPEEKIYGEEPVSELDPNIKKAPLILDADSSQVSAITDVIWRGKDLVIDGPPGTGKSQSIANIIAAALARGKTVLFVAEKKAALDVVRTRLDQAGLGWFTLELHSSKTHKGMLHADIKRRMEARFNHEDKLDKLYDDLKSKREQLVTYSEAANEVVGPYGEAVHELFWRVEKYRLQLKGQPIRLAVENALKLSGDQITNRTQLLEDIVRLCKDLPTDAMKAWKGFWPESILPGEEERIAEILKSVEQAV